MVGVLGDERLREFNRGAARHDPGIAHRYASLVAGSSDPDEFGSTGSSAAVQTRSRSGPSQATLTTRGGRSTAKRRLVIGVDWQSEGFASEAARALVEWLWQHGADDVIACIRPRYQASAVVGNARRAASDYEQRDGEHVWRAPDGARPYAVTGTPRASAAGSSSLESTCSFRKMLVR
jgi:hypothetical protein